MQSAKGKTIELSAPAKQALRAEVPAIEAALRRMLPSFDRSGTTCGCCGLYVSTHWADTQAYEVVNSALKKLDRLVQSAASEGIAVPRTPEF